VCAALASGAVGLSQSANRTARHRGSSGIFAAARCGRRESLRTDSLVFVRFRSWRRLAKTFPVKLFFALRTRDLRRRYEKFVPKYFKTDALMNKNIFVRSAKNPYSIACSSSPPKTK